MHIVPKVISAILSKKRVEEVVFFYHNFFYNYEYIDFEERRSTDIVEFFAAYDWIELLSEKNKNEFGIAGMLNVSAYQKGCSSILKMKKRCVIINFTKNVFKVGIVAFSINVVIAVIFLLLTMIIKTANVVHFCFNVFLFGLAVLPVTFGFMSLALIAYGIARLLKQTKKMES